MLAITQLKRLFSGFENLPYNTFSTFWPEFRGKETWSPAPSPGLNHSANVDPSFVKSPKQWAQYGIFGVNNAHISYCVDCFWPEQGPITVGIQGNRQKAGHVF